MKIGIFGGSFDPVHREHVRLAQAAIKSLALDRLFIMPAHTPPHKQGKLLSSDKDRFRMCELAFEGIERVEISDYELKVGGTSYTYLTLAHFKQLYPEAELFFLVGTDMLRDFPSWRYPERILETATLAVCARNEEQGWLETEQATFLKRFSRKFAVIGYNGENVSSTRIRVLAAAGEDISAFVEREVASYVQEKGLYEIFGAKEALALEKGERKAHSIRVAFYAAEHAGRFKLDEKKAVTAALFHDCAKNLPQDSPLLRGFCPPEGVPAPVWHQYAGAYVAKTAFGVSDEEILEAISFHTSGKPNMSPLAKLIYLADMLEEGRTYGEAVILRRVFEERGLDEGYFFALERSLAYLREKGGEVYRLTEEAAEYEEKTIKNTENK
ncbi:MAG: nicotinate (nicotinamide) nucleotide adenylyltransferase [Clostridia bacterium]|nr:nicotinate (nicotinamide) nucleotide adenylyltransferase [Clostridia bacterium]